MGIMTIDGQAIEFTDEPNVLISLPCVIIRNYLSMVPVDYAR